MPIQNSERLLQKILLEETVESIILLKSLKVEINGVNHDLTPYAIPNNEQIFQVSNYHHFVEVKLTDRHSSAQRLRLDCSESETSEIESSESEDSDVEQAIQMNQNRTPHIIHRKRCQR